MKKAAFICILIYTTGLTHACNLKPDHSTVSTVQEETPVKPVRQTLVLPQDITLEKEFLYDQHTLEDVYPYKDTTRKFQWDKVKERLSRLENIQGEPAAWGVLQNRRNVHGAPPAAKGAKKDEYNELDDRYGVEDRQSVPLYSLTDAVTPERYGRDGSLVKISKQDGEYIEASVADLDGTWRIPERYVKVIETTEAHPFNKVILVDRTNQNIATLEGSGTRWLIRSMNPATTGLHKPPYERPTPLGIFVVQEKKEKMFYTADGGQEIVGFAPYASRFSNGGYVHGIPVNNPNGKIVEFSTTLGTTPRSHMCVRNATSHAKYVYDWAPVGKALVIVIE
ncbi:MAG: L,D-transpeptidase [Tannerellaceae bacterium]|nr:L,D-transpeptidase [Tannerellaceae bacterium]